MFRIGLFLLLSFSSLFSFETTNVQLLYSNNFKGDAFIYDTVDGKKTTLTFEHYRTFNYGDIFMFVDMMDGEKFNAVDFDVYTEIGPRFSLSKMSGKDFSFGFIKDIYIATQLNIGSDYRAYLGGIGTDIDVAGFNFLQVNIYYKSDNFDNKTFQISPAYQSKSYYDVHVEGFIDFTGDDINTQNQLLYNLSKVLKTKEQIHAGLEWIYYKHDDNSKTSVVQAMIKYTF